MFSPITTSDASPSSLGLYVPVHRRTPSDTNSSRTPSPSPSTSLLPMPGVYTPAELLLLSTSPLAKLSVRHLDALRALAPEVVQTRRQRKASAWRARHPAASSSASHTHTRTSSRGSSHASESEEDRATTWRRTR